MQVGLTDEQIQFRDMVARFLADKSPPSAVRNLMESSAGYDPDVWQQLAGELGLLGTHLPEAYGGFGFGPVELGLIAQQMGRHLYCGPFFASAVMAGYAVLNQGDERQKQRLLGDIAAGSTIAALVLDDLNAPERVGQHLVAQGATISGEAPLVVDAQVANLLVVAARAADGLGLFVVDPAAGGVRVTPLEVVDPTRKLCRVAFQNAPAEQLGEGPADLALLWDQLSSVLANEMIGGAEVLFESTIEYLKMRVQFGRPIGSFQGLKHRCADLLVELELARAAADGAMRYLAEGGADTHLPNMAKALASDTYMSIAKQAIQLRGGIGFTWEEDTHLWYKRAKASEVMLGTAAWHREAMMSKIEAREAPLNV